MNNLSRLTELTRTILIVHGITADHHQSFEKMARRLTNSTPEAGDTFVPGLDYNVYAVKYHLGYGLDALGAKLACEINERVFGGPIDIIAHGIGGIVTRSAMELYGCSDNVARFITLSSPHQGNSALFWGSLLANSGNPENDLLDECECGTYLPEFDDLTIGSDFYARLNSIPFLPYTRKCLFIAGTAPDLPQPFWTNSLGIWSLLQSPHDGMVEQFSAWGTDETCQAENSFLKLIYTECEFAEFPLNHEYIFKDKQVFDKIDNWFGRSYGDGIINIE
jgi:hypothetical protein